MRIVCISDTHRQHAMLALPQGDVLVHAGDFTNVGRPADIDDFARWLATAPFGHKVVVAGNHDLMLRDGNHLRQTLAKFCPAAHYLEDSGTAIEGVRFWGAPWGPFSSLAVKMPKGADLAERWSRIPADTDVLVTHIPPQGTLDFDEDQTHCGCPELARALERVQPRLHVFGHNHAEYGQHRGAKTQFVNAASCDVKYIAAHAPIVVELERRA